MRKIVFTALCFLSVALCAETALAAAVCEASKTLQAVTVPGWCLSVAADEAQGLRMPRTILWMGKKDEVDQLLVVDMGSWEPRRGRLLLVQIDTRKGRSEVTELLIGLDRPHGLRKGPDGRVYMGEATRISRFAWAGKGPIALEPVITGLPAEGRHPLKEFVFAPDRTMYLNVGAATDRCEKQSGVSVNGMPSCPEMSAAAPQAAVYHAKFSWPDGTLSSLKPFAIGLRNSMALAVHPSGAVFQAENNIDFPDENFPAEEVNHLVEGAHYGWPSCVQNRLPLNGVKADACQKTRAPVLLVPAHAAPLHMQFSRIGFSEAASGNALGLLMSWHGYRAAGQKLVRYKVLANGTPAGAPELLVHQWKVTDAKGNAKPGAPVAWAEDDSGSLWIADDRNRMIVWFHRANAER